MIDLTYKEENAKIKVAVAISGGVDSSVVASILKKQGYDIFGVTMRTCGEEDADAKRVCDDLGIEHFVVDVEEDFKKDVMDYFVAEYVAGRTPNPCMVCNRHIKFGKLLDFAEAKGADYMATGHYASIVDGKLAIGEDAKKDQVYFLSQIPKEQLSKILFPIGQMEKTEIRALAKEFGIRVHAKKDSQEICFVEDGKLQEFLEENSQAGEIRPGNIVDKEGKILGKHRGLSFYTIGQRKGLGISSPTPYYVLELRRDTNEILVGSNEDLMREELIAKDVNLYHYNKMEDLDGLSCLAKTRSRDHFHACVIKVVGDRLHVRFTEPVRAVTPGQGLVLYDAKGRVLAGAFIEG